MKFLPFFLDRCEGRFRTTAEDILADMIPSGRGLGNSSTVCRKPTGTQQQLAGLSIFKSTQFCVGRENLRAGSVTCMQVYVGGFECRLLQELLSLRHLWREFPKQTTCLTTLLYLGIIVVEVHSFTFCWFVRVSGLSLWCNAQ